MDEYRLEKLWTRIHNLTRRVTLRVADDTHAYQTHQIEGYPGELHNSVPRPQDFGFSTVPLPNSEAVVINNNGGYLHTQAIVSTHDPRYRAKNQKPGEAQVSIVDGADGKGENGTLRAILQGRLGWIANLIGKTINVGDTNAVTVNIATTGSVTINMGGSSATVNITGSSGDVTVGGISLRHHLHSGVTPGSGNTGQPV